MQRTIDDYDSMTKREIIKAKQEKAQMYVHYLISKVLLVSNLLTLRRVQKFRADYADLRSQFERLRGEASAAVRGEFMSRPPVSLNMSNAATRSQPC